MNDSSRWRPTKIALSAKRYGDYFAGQSRLLVGNSRLFIHRNVIMKITFKNPLAVPAVADHVKATIADFSFGWSLRLKHPPAPRQWRHFDDALNRLFVCDKPQQIQIRGLPPTRWFAVTALTGNPTFYGFARVPTPNLCASGFTSSMCRPTQCFLETAMRLRGVECSVTVTHVGTMLNNDKYNRQWEANARSAILEYLDQPKGDGLRCVTSGHDFVPIVTEAEPIGIDLLFSEAHQ